MRSVGTRRNMRAFSADFCSVGPDQKSGDDMPHAGEYGHQTYQPENANHRVQLKRNLCNDLRRELQNQRSREVVEKNHQTDSGEEGNRTFNYMFFPPFRGGLLFSNKRPGRFVMFDFFWRADYLLVHAIQRTRNFFSYLLDFQILDHLFQLGHWTTIATCNRFA